MRVRNLQCTDAVLKGGRKPPGFACASRALLLSILFITLAGPALTQAVSPAPNIISPTEQASRDDERIRILRDELRKAEALVESLAKRKAERLAVADVSAADEAEEGRVRALSDIAGLQREIAATRGSAPGAKAPSSAGTAAMTATATATPTTPGTATPQRATAPKSSPPVTPWWDVYSKARRTDAPAPVSFAQPHGATEAPALSPRRME